MKHTLLYTALVFSGLSATAAQAATQTDSQQTTEKTIVVQVKDRLGSPVAGAQLFLDGNKKLAAGENPTITDNQGLVKVKLPLGDSTLDVEAGDIHFHHPVTLSADTNYDRNAPLVVSLKQEPEHKIVIMANPLEHTTLDMATPITVISGDELVTKRAGTLGEILQLEPGLSTSSFGPAVSRPVIRGLAGARVKITNNQMTLQDASTTSGDHDTGIEPMLANQVEVIKGPATLLYGSGAVGGVINTLDKKINLSPEPGVSGGYETRLADSTTGERTHIVTMDLANENWNVHFDGSQSKTDDITIPGFAESARLRAAEEAEEAESGEEEHEEHEEAFGLLENSASDKKAYSLGTSYVTDSGYIGLAVNKISELYGIPGHSHEEEEEDDANHSEDEEGGVSIDLEQTRTELQMGLEDVSPLIDKIFVGFVDTDYEHKELEGSDVGTRFINNAQELRSYLKHGEVSGWQGILGVHMTDRDFSAIGDEAFIPQSVTKNNALFILEERNFGNLKWELGARYENQSVEVDGRNSIDDSGTSFSAGAVYTLSHHNKLAFNLSHSVRFPTVEELHSFGAHEATESFEIGNQNLDKETAQNIDLSYRFEWEEIRGEFNLFYNQFDNFIFGANASATDACVPSDAAADALSEGLLLVCYEQNDADFSGFEFTMDWPLAQIGKHRLEMNFQASNAVARFTQEGINPNLPRIPPRNYGFSLNDDWGDWHAGVSVLTFEDQLKVADNELATDGYTRVDFDLSYRIANANSDWLLFLKGRNLLDEEIRSHASFIKDIAPSFGKSWLVGLRVTF